MTDSHQVSLTLGHPPTNVACITLPVVGVGEEGEGEPSASEALTTSERKMKFQEVR